ncbi:tyrosine 3-monooxygenase-like [Diadema antillarum]|uniref:tyrosine 3-monooxygenase-like n=1 Tax=Diadema antillarum TaxID=105358 RepID=UPI003A8A61BB
MMDTEEKNSISANNHDNGENGVPVPGPRKPTHFRSGPMMARKGYEKLSKSFDGVSYVYPIRKQSLIEDARRESTRSSLDITSLSLVLSSPEEKDDVFDDAFEAVLENAVRRFTVTFASKDGAGFGSLSEALRVFQKKKVTLTHVESRPSPRVDGQIEFLVQCETKGSSSKTVLTALQKVVDNVRLEKEEVTKRGPWFPKRINELDRCTHLLSNYEPDLDNEHPGFSDKAYRERRQRIADIAFKYKHGEPIPRVDYTEDELRTWGLIYRQLKAMFPTHACKVHIDAFNVLEKEGIYSETFVPQLEDVSNFLKAKTGFQLRPVAGLLSARDFLASLAFRVFQATQYIRHSSAPMHTPEPDCCHELLGHVPMLADPTFAQFSQEIGLASLGVSDEDITRLATLYWFTVEFGLCKQDGEIRAYGAGLLSAFGELQYALSDKPEHRPFDPNKTAVQEYQDKTYQPIYFVSDSFDDAKSKLRLYAMKMARPYNVRYDPYTQSVQVIDKVDKLRDAIRDLNDQMVVLTSAIEKLT